jgi:3-oxoacyl-[acyl-carrier-protein] synthase III
LKRFSETKKQADTVVLDILNMPTTKGNVKFKNSKQAMENLIENLLDKNQIPSFRKKLFILDVDDKLIEVKNDLL